MTINCLRDPLKPPPPTSHPFYPPFPFLLFTDYGRKKICPLYFRDNLGKKGGGRRDFFSFLLMRKGSKEEEEEEAPSLSPWFVPAAVGADTSLKNRGIIEMEKLFRLAEIWHCLPLKARLTPSSPASPFLHTNRRALCPVFLHLKAWIWDSPTVITTFRLFYQTPAATERHRGRQRVGSLASPPTPSLPDIFLYRCPRLCNQYVS